MHLFIFLLKKKCTICTKLRAVSCVKPNATQWEATLRDDVGFPSVIAEYTVANYVIQSDVALHTQVHLNLLYLLT